MLEGCIAALVPLTKEECKERGINIAVIKCHKIAGNFWTKIVLFFGKYCNIILYNIIFQ